jgi:hypothetical protein
LAYGVNVADTPVCEGHTDPLHFFSEWIYDRPPQSVVHGSRGAGKSFLCGLAAHIDSVLHDRHETKILGGSEAQSAQIYNAIKQFGEIKFLEDDVSPTILATKAEYATGSSVSYIPASPKSARGPHVPLLCLDEVDEIDAEIREAAIGMSMDIRGIPGSISYTSTWHKPSGPMSQVIEEGRKQGWPVYTFCAFEILERCPEERSGPNLEKCPECPLVKWCHEDKDRHPTGLPKAKRSNGHYTIKSLIQKVQNLTLRVFESDFLCMRPRSPGMWFTDFDNDKHVTAAAGFDRNVGVHVAIDCGVHTGAIWFQVKPSWDGSPSKVNVFADYYAYGLSADANAKAIVAQTEALCGISIRACRVSMDPAGNARNAVGPIVKGEYERAGCLGRNGLETWPVMGAHRPKADTLGFIEALLLAADGTVRMTLHPRCKNLVNAFLAYSRATKNNTLMDYPKPECHPEEDLIDPLAGGLVLEFPEGRTPPPQLIRRHASAI